MMRQVGRRIALFFIPLLSSWLIRLWFSTCRITIHNGTYREQAERRGKPIIGTCWHYAIIGIFSFYREMPLVLMISSSKDGDFLTRMAELLNFSVVRGSSNRKGAVAAKELIRELRKGKSAGLVADGSQGPARIAQGGALLLAAKTDATILPMLWSASSYFALNTWDKLIIPKPFARIDLFYGKPVILPETFTMAGSEEYRKDLEMNLNSIYEDAWLLHGKKFH